MTLDELEAVLDRAVFEAVTGFLIGGLAGVIALWAGVA